MGLGWCELYNKGHMTERKRTFFLPLSHSTSGLDIVQQPTAQLRLVLRGLITQIIIVQGSIDNVYVQRHLKDGLARRLYMLDHGLKFFDTVPLVQDKPLGFALMIELNTMLNAAYLNISGALDNAAWALAYHLKLKRDLSEDDSEHRRFIGLFKREFLASVTELNPNLGAALGGFAPWGNELRKYRDPAAHRIPLYVAPAAVTAEEAAVLIAKEQAGLQHAKATGDQTGLNESITQNFTTGSFHAVFGLYEGEGYRPHSLFPTLDRDFTALMKAITIVIEDFSNSSHGLPRHEGAVR
jgi:hypothetical protein